MTMPSSAEILRHLERVSQLGIAAIEEEVTARAPWLRRRPVDPATVLTEDVLPTLRRVTNELETLIGRIEDTTREWDSEGQSVAIVQRSASVFAETGVGGLRGAPSAGGESAAP